MIILVEGPRGAGKSHLVDNFFAQNRDDKFIYYKWGFANWVETLGIEENGVATHYFSLANILTVLEMGSTLFKDRVLVLDRSIFSAYVWAAYRERLPRFELTMELKKILESPIYHSCNTIYINRDERVKEFNRGNKDIFDKYENYGVERQEFDEIFTLFNSHLNQWERGNRAFGFNNAFDPKSQVEFNNLLYSFVDK